jgi:cobalt/nickel transport system permease protein
VLAAMVGVHSLIGIGEGVITALTVGVVLGVRPDLVYGAQDLKAPLVLASRPEPATREVR